MNISDLIQQLQEIQQKHGDLPVGVEIKTKRKKNGRYYNHVDATTVYTSIKGMFYPVEGSNISTADKICHISCQF